MSDAADALHALDLLGLTESGGDAHRFELQATPDLCTPFGFLYGGTGIAASVEASERATRRPLQWITTQFLGSPAPGDVVEFEVDVAVTGRSTSQTSITGRVGDELVLTSLAAHNVRPTGDEASFGEMPTVPGPEECPAFLELFEQATSGSFFDYFDRRVAAGTIGPGAVGNPQSGPIALWCRLTDGGVDSAASQAFVADLGPLAVCATLGVAPGGTSLDNTLRVVSARSCEWVLVEIEADGFSRSVGHSTARLWSEDGRLLAIAQQSAIIRTSHHS